MNTDSSESRCKITTKNPKNNGFQIKWQSVALKCRPWHSKTFIFQHFIAVILHSKGKAMDSESISFREELRLDAPQRTEFPEPFPFGMGTASYEG